MPHGARGSESGRRVRAFGPPIFPEAPPLAPGISAPRRVELALTAGVCIEPRPSCRHQESVAGRRADFAPACFAGCRIDGTGIAGIWLY